MNEIRKALERANQKLDSNLALSGLQPLGNKTYWVQIRVQQDPGPGSKPAAKRKTFRPCERAYELFFREFTGQTRVRFNGRTLPVGLLDYPAEGCSRWTASCNCPLKGISEEDDESLAA